MPENITSWLLMLMLSQASWAQPQFRTCDGQVVPAVTASEMKEIDRLALDQWGPNLFQMMENAGRSLALEALDMLGPKSGRHVVVLAGSGGNGGGGLAAARHLANRGLKVTVVLAQPEPLSEVAQWQMTVFRSTSGIVATDPPEADLVVDALIGYGLKGSPQGRAAELIGWANLQSAPILALDVPSGLDATTGEAPGPVVRAHRTLTLALPKTGLRSKYTGQLVLADLGIPEKVFNQAQLQVGPLFGSKFRLPLFYSPGY